MIVVDTSAVQVIPTIGGGVVYDRSTLTNVNTDAADTTSETSGRLQVGVGVIFTRISDMAVVPYRQDQAPRLDFWGSDIRNHTTEGDTLWVNYTTSHFSSRSTVS